MKFIFSDSLDYVDPEFDFIGDRNKANRRPHQDDHFPHEYLDRAPYDGILISRAIVGDRVSGGKYTEAQWMRFLREGARAFLRYDSKQYPGSVVMGDCGAFSYRDAEKPPHSVESILEFYEDGGFTHGCSVDHLIFDFLDDRARPSAKAKKRQEITLANARDFLKASRQLGRSFTPLGVIQGWSPASMAHAAASLVKMGYTYLAIGGCVPLKIDQIERALQAIRGAIPAKTRLHLLGFGKFDQWPILERFAVTSFDTTSPLLRAFKDAKRNYFVQRQNGEIDYYTAIRIPQAIDNAALLRRAKRGQLNQESLLALEEKALSAVRSCARKECSVDSAVDAVLSYARYALWDDKAPAKRNEAKLRELSERYRRTLNDRPWANCPCRVCKDVGVEVMLFRSSNRNKRRGIHNLHVFYNSLKTHRQASAA
ncbi:MAG: tRNA-guanine transglycosylase DpdA [Vulcanimicrobiaceae bacterium]